MTKITNLEHAMLGAQRGKTYTAAIMARESLWSKIFN